jgi:hypothetical protein
MGYRRCDGRVRGVGLKSDFLKLHVGDDEVNGAGREVDVARGLGGGRGGDGSGCDGTKWWS